MKHPWRWLILTGVVAVLGLAYAALWQSPAPRPGAFVIDLPAIRALAAGANGPVEIRAIQVAQAPVPRGAMIAGESLFTKQPIVIISYQLIYADGSSVIIDSAHDLSLHQRNFDPNGVGFDSAAFDQMQQAMLAARLILVTHEHLDHLGGIAQSPYLAELAPKVLLTKAQATGPTLSHVGFKPGDLERFNPVDLRAPLSPAAGVVLIPAPGHSSGSQLIYVRRADGHEFLFVGDIAWDAGAIRSGVGRPYLVSHYMLREDRQAVVDQLLALQPLLQDPMLTVIVAHDDSQYQSLQQQGLISNGLRLPEPTSH